MPVVREGEIFTVAEIQKMDKATLRTLLESYGLPTSGKISALQERLAEVACT